MIRKDKSTSKDGSTKTYVRVTEGYRPYPGAPPKQRTIQSFGYIEDQEDLDAFWAAVNECNDNIKDKTSSPDARSAHVTKLGDGTNMSVNYGYKFLESVYKSLGIDEFIKMYEMKTGSQGQYPLAEIFRFLVIDRILHPASKRDAMSRLENYYGLTYDFELEDVYRALDKYDEFFYELQVYISNKVKGMLGGRDLDHSYYDVTNYYLEKDDPDPDGSDIDPDGELACGPALEQKDASQENEQGSNGRMGLFVDENGIPICMDLYPGNTCDSATLKESLAGFKKGYGVKRTIVVADKGIDCSHDIDLLCSQGDGYVFSQALHGTKGKRYQDELFSDEGWTAAPDGSYKTKLLKEEHQGQEIHYEVRDGQTVEVSTPVTRTRQVLLYWSSALAAIAEERRLDKIMDAEMQIMIPSAGSKKSASPYIKEIAVAADTGEVRDKEQAKKVWGIAWETIAKDALYDGWYVVITSEMDLDAAQIREICHDLWHIEETFRLMKSDFDAGPVYVKTRAHVRAHFLICFTSLVIIRLIQHHMGEQSLSAQRIAAALNAATCHTLSGGLVFLDDMSGEKEYAKRQDKKAGKMASTKKLTPSDQIFFDYTLIQDTFGTSFYWQRAKQEDFNRSFRDMHLRYLDTRDSTT